MFQGYSMVGWASLHRMLSSNCLNPRTRQRFVLCRSLVSLWLNLSIDIPHFRMLLEIPPSFMYRFSATSICLYFSLSSFLCTQYDIPNSPVPSDILIFVSARPFLSHHPLAVPILIPSFIHFEATNINQVSRLLGKSGRNPSRSVALGYPHVKPREQLRS